MKKFIDLIKETNADESQWTTALKGGSIGERNIRSARDLKGLPVKERGFLRDTRDQAKADAKQSNKGLSPGEKKYYGLRYIVVEVVDGKYTGK